MVEFFKKAFKDMVESAKDRHEVDKANFAAVKAESKANFEEAKAIGNPETLKAKMKAEHDTQISEANKQINAANKRIQAVKKNK